MGVGGVEGRDGSDEELPSSKDPPPEEGGEEPGGYGGIPDPPATRISASAGLVILPPKGFPGRPMS
jgi:hypothetical protein